MPVVHRILVPVDFSPCSRAAMEYAMFLAEKLDAVVDVLHVWQVPSYVDPEMMVNIPGSATQPLAHYAKVRAENDMREFLVSLPEPLREGVHGQVEQGDPVTVILEVAHDRTYDLIVMGTYGRTAISHMIVGSVAERIVRRAPCPVLTIRVPSSERKHPSKPPPP